MGDFKIYYGEYTLKHWLSLVLRKEIELPSYQRNFVWTEDKVKKLIQSFNEDLFVPPITIGTYSLDGEEKKHYILDGQQRLSAVLLAFLGKFPDKDFDIKDYIKMADDNDNNDEDDDNDDTDIRAWQLTSIQELNVAKKKDEIRKKLRAPKYKELDCPEVDEDFLLKKYLGFSYIKPSKLVNEVAQKKYYSSIFRNINISGEPLTAEESRSSLYWLNSKLEPFFKPAVLDEISIDNNKIDFARYLAFTAEYMQFYQNKSQRFEVHPVARGYGNKRKPYEKFIEKFVYHIVEEDSSSAFLPWGDMFEKEINFDAENEYLIETLKAIRGDTKFSSIIDSDYYIFGLVFWSLFMRYEISDDHASFVDLKNKIDTKIKKMKKDIYYLRRPSSIGRIRERIHSSIMMYHDYAEEQDD